MLNFWIFNGEYGMNRFHIGDFFISTIWTWWWIFIPFSLHSLVLVLFGFPDTRVWRLARTQIWGSNMGMEPICLFGRCPICSDHWQLAMDRNPQPAHGVCERTKPNSKLLKRFIWIDGLAKLPVWIFLGHNTCRTSAEWRQFPWLARFNGGATSRGEAHAWEICNVWIYFIIKPWQKIEPWIGRTDKKVSMTNNYSDELFNNSIF